ncbi:hypothetical protein GCM10009847_24340 [Leucobacter tardus]
MKATTTPAVRMKYHPKVVDAQTTTLPMTAPAWSGAIIAQKAIAMMADPDPMRTGQRTRASAVGTGPVGPCCVEMLSILGIVPSHRPEGIEAAVPMLQ